MRLVITALLGILVSGCFCYTADEHVLPWHAIDRERIVSDIKANGYEITWASLDDDVQGRTDSVRKVVEIAIGLTPERELETLAHERIHTYQCQDGNCAVCASSCEDKWAIEEPAFVQGFHVSLAIGGPDYVLERWRDDELEAKTDRYDCGDCGYAIDSRDEVVARYIESQGELQEAVAD